MCLAVIACVSEVVGTELPMGAPLMAAGVDSIGATELQQTLSETFSSGVPATLLFDHPSIEGIVTFFSLELFACLHSNIQPTPVAAQI